MSNKLANLEYPALFMFGTFGNDESSSNVCRAIIVIRGRWPPLSARMVESLLLGSKCIVVFLLCVFCLRLFLNI
jgi:hypothetical protein